MIIAIIAVVPMVDIDFDGKANTGNETDAATGDDKRPLCLHYKVNQRISRCLGPYGGKYAE